MVNTGDFVNFFADLPEGAGVSTVEQALKEACQKILAQQVEINDLKTRITELEQLMKP